MDQLKRLPTACRTAFCAEHATERGYCPTHAKENPPTSGFRSKKYETEYRHLYDDTRWRHKRRGLKVLTLQAFPVCTKCHRNPSAHVHHVKPHRGNPELFFDPNNLTAICQPCHAAETAAEIAARRKGGNEPSSPLSGNIIVGGV
jgi:5-methylcytosine-specific restriction protein A